MLVNFLLFRCAVGGEFSKGLQCFYSHISKPLTKTHSSVLLPSAADLSDVWCEMEAFQHSDSGGTTQVWGGASASSSGASGNWSGVDSGRGSNSSLTMAGLGMIATPVSGGYTKVRHATLNGVVLGGGWGAGCAAPTPPVRTCCVFSIVCVFTVISNIAGGSNLSCICACLPSI